MSPLLLFLFLTPTLRVTAPKTVIWPVGAPLSVTIRVGVSDPPDCFGLVIFYGDGEKSIVETCDETSVQRDHKYHSEPSHGADTVGNEESYFLGEVQLWVMDEKKGKGRLETRAVFRITIVGS